VRDGSKGPLVVDVVKHRVVARTPRRQQGDEELVVVLRYRDRDNQQVVKGDFSLSNAEPGTPLGQLARVAKAEHRLEACLQRSKSEAGLADDAGRHWTGWHHHQTLSLRATWFLVTETLRGEKMDASDDVTAETGGHRGDLVQRVSVRNAITYAA
jgi:SRSO17 transposase